MINIAYIIDTINSPTGGTERQLLMLLNELDRNRFKPSLICLRSSEWLRNNKFDFDLHILNVRSMISPDFVKGIIRFRRLYKMNKYDIIQTFFTDSNIFGTIAGKILKCNMIVSSRRNIGYWHNRVHIMILRVLKYFTNFYLCNSIAAKKMTVEVERVDPSKVHVIYNGLDLNKFLTIDDEKRRRQRNSWSIRDDELIIGAVANLRPIKNITLLIEAAHVLIKKIPKLKFVVVGEGPQREELQKKINSYDMADSFLLVGRSYNITEPLAAFDIAVLPSQSESFSNSLIEYMAAGLPIVASNVGGNQEAIENEKTGLLFESNDLNGLLKCLEHILLNRQIPDELAAKARERAFEFYDKKQIINSHQDFYENIMEKLS